MSLHLRLSPLALLLIALAMLIWLTRGPDRPARKAAQKPPRPALRAAPFVISQDRPARADRKTANRGAPSDFDAETEHLNREAADRGRHVYDDTNQRFDEAIERMNERNEQRNKRAAARR